MSELLPLDQTPFANAPFADNPEPRCPCVLLLDTSGSMSGDPIHQLNEGIITFRDELSSDSLASKRVEVATVTFGPVQATDFVTVDQFYPPAFEASGDTPLGHAVSRGLQLLSDRKTLLRSNGIQLFRPWVFLITDGAPTDNWSGIEEQVKRGEADKSFAFFAIGVDNADFDFLKTVSVRDPIKLRGLMFKEFFLWLSASLKSVSRSNPGDIVALPDIQPYGWADV